MLKSYEAIYDHGRVEWIGSEPRLEHGRVLVVVEEAPDVSEAGSTNGDRLADLLEGLETTRRKSLTEKFGDPVAWQREERQERQQPGREQR
ncbi:MAG: hypothetical protein JNK74_02285 [Candidatus Hydrogenedentes bacterium]|nr:hypothetical protein [Candidatus Hydrogenedentota bacterium]